MKCDIYHRENSRYAEHHVFFTGQSTTFSRSLTGQSSGKRENDETFELQDCVLFASKVIMTETFGFLPDKRPVNFWYIFDVHSTEGRYSCTES